MKAGDAEYDRLVQDFSRKLQEAKGNIESKKMTEEETQAEIDKVTEGAFLTTDEMGDSVRAISIEAPKKRRGRPPGSRNKPKA